MLYRLISTSNIVTDDFLEVILGNRGITDKERFLEPKASDEIHYSNLHNIKEAVALFKEIENRGRVEVRKIRVALIIDSDIDGNTSSAILASYIENLFPHIELIFLFHEGKQHGITEDKVKEIVELNKETALDLLIVADAGTSDYRQQYLISEKHEIPILILDHHEAENGESEFALVVNNQLSDNYPNKALSGVGIVYKFLQALDDEYGYMEAEEYLDLVALGNIADSMDLTSPETRYLVYEGLKDIRNGFLKEIILKQIGDFKRVYPHTLAFGVIPKMNGIIRVGKPEEKIDLFNAFRGFEQATVNPRSKKSETLPQKVTRQCVNAHKRQKTMREKWVVKIREQIVEKNLHENAFLLIELEESFDRDLSGYLAGALAGEYRKPVLMLVWDSKIERFSGSLRGYDGTMKNTKDFLEGLNLFDYLGGHQNACGFKISRDSLFSLNGAINSALEEQNLTGHQKIDVDFYLEDGQLTTELVNKVFEYEYLWGKGARKPLFAIDIEVDTNRIKKSSSSNMIEWYHNNIKFLQFTCDRRLLDLMEDGHIVNLTIVGSLSVNYFLGKSTPQFIIEDIAIGEKTELTPIEEVKVDDLFNW
ncbi:single-stranded-DNA-specific exonuclease [Lysinibacillus sp. AC-3]|uniref:DHH family phosphoesterase n=1 Tax=unclassified Lysinibacillus TaxID=2636778 RepID=UPI0009C60C13|nr:MULTISPECIES: DHH family phosphoesterase [unclassified Lysinibacillus]SKB64457.1 single-stranded-DNA-specific exonuclease [Lysinibacillus sp. AC-3]